MALISVYPDFILDSAQVEAVYTGSWTTGQSDDQSKNLTYKYASSTTQGDSVTITPDIDFTDAFLYGYAAPDGGYMKVFVDNVEYATVDCYGYVVSNKSMKNANHLHIKGLTKRKHTIRLENTGMKSTVSSGTKIGFNYLRIMNPAFDLNEKNKTILFIGDSISTDAYAYTDAPFKRILNQNFPSNAMNIAYMVRPSGGSFIGRFAENEIIAQRASFVSCMVGTNDINANPTQDTEGNIKMIIEACEKLGVPLQLCTITPRTGGFDSVVNGMSNMIRFLCFQYGLPCIDFNKGVFNQTVDAPAFNSDGLHPNPVGHSVMARFMFKEMLSSKNPFRTLLR